MRRRKIVVQKSFLQDLSVCVLHSANRAPGNRWGRDYQINLKKMKNKIPIKILGLNDEVTYMTHREEFKSSVYIILHVSITVLLTSDCL